MDNESGANNPKVGRIDINNSSHIPNVVDAMLIGRIDMLEKKVAILTSLVNKLSELIRLLSEKK